jgi:transposase InsO family protein
MCEYWQVSRQAFYKGVRADKEQSDNRAIILAEVRNLRKEHVRLGTLKLMNELKERLRNCGRGFGRDKFFELLRVHDLLIKRRRRYSVTTDSNHGFYKYSNHLEGAQVNAPDQAWVSDITYLKTRDKFVYLSLVTDVYSRKIVGWNVNRSLAVEGAMSAVRMALNNCPRSTRGLIHHSDKGVQYCCHVYTEHLKRKQVKISMGEAGNCYDNAIAERVNGILKDEYLLDSEFLNEKHALKAVREAVYLYNYKRPHWSLNLQKPADVYDQKGSKGSLKEAGTAPLQEQDHASFIRS